jgi:hypothetical protein
VNTINIYQFRQTRSSSQLTIFIKINFRFSFNLIVIFTVLAIYIHRKWPFLNRVYVNVNTRVAVQWLSV